MKIVGVCILLLVLNIFASLAAACIPPPTVECGGRGKGGSCEVFNNQGFWEDRAECHAATSAFPTTEKQLLAAVAAAVKKKQKINVVSDLAHSHPKLACVGSGGLIISTRNYDSIVRINAATARAPTITVQSGALMRDVIDAAAKEGLALPTLTSWDGVSAGGCISTGAHGSGIVGKGSVIDEYVVGMRLIVPARASQGYARVVEVGEDDPDLKAARLSLGTLGVISEITFALEPMFKRSISVTLEEDGGLEDRLEEFSRSHEFGKIYWFLALGRLSWRGLIGFLFMLRVRGSIRPLISPPPCSVEQNAANYERIAREGNLEELCNASETSMYSRAANGDGYLNDGVSFTGNPVVGFNHLMQSTGGCQVYGRKHENDSSCMPHSIIGQNKSICEWDRRVHGSLSYDVELRVPLKVASAAMKDIKALRDMNPQAMCALNGILIRTMKKSESYLGPNEDMLTFEISYPRSRRAFSPTWNMEFYQEIEQMLVEKYGGSLHWGKSGGHLFEGLAARSTVSLRKFLKVKKRFDPNGVFSNDWIERVLGIGGKRVEVFGERCAVEKLCKCREDAHCAPQQGYFCRPGRLWKNARVCRKVN